MEIIVAPHLLVRHSIEYGHKPVVKVAVVLVRDDEVAYPVHAPLAQRFSIELEVPQVARRHALDEVLCVCVCVCTGVCAGVCAGVCGGGVSP